MRAQFIGLKPIKGKNARTGREYDFKVANIISPMSERDVQRSAVGKDVHSPIVPDFCANVLCVENIGKEIEINFVYANGHEIIGYCALAGK